MGFLQKYKYLIGGSALLAGLGTFLILKSRNNEPKQKQKGNVKALNWSNDTNFFTNSYGKDLYALGRKAGITMSRNIGLNNSKYSENKYKTYKANPNVYWAIYDITGDTLIDSSPNANKNLYGASVPKVCVASACFNNNGGTLPTDADYQKVIKLLVKSDNNVWTDIQNLAGGGLAVNEWANKMGYTMKPSRGTGDNTSNAFDMCKFWNDVCRNNFNGAENIFRISSSCQTDASRGRKYMPPNLYMGGKTGTYGNSNHDCCWLQDGDKFYSISVLTELGSNGSDVIASIFRGLYDEYIKK